MPEEDDAPPPGFLFSLPDADMTPEDVSEIAAICTGETFAKLYPEKARAIVLMRGEGIAVDRVAKYLGVSAHTVLAVEDLRRQSVDEIKVKTGRKLAVGMYLLTDSLVDDIVSGKLKPSEKAFALNVLAEKALLLNGDATAVVEVTHKHVLSPEQWAAHMQALKEVTGMVLEAEKATALPVLAAESEVVSPVPPVVVASGKDALGDCAETPGYTVQKIGDQYLAKQGQ